MIRRANPKKWVYGLALILCFVLGWEASVLYINRMTREPSSDAVFGEKMAFYQPPTAEGETGAVASIEKSRVDDGAGKAKNVILLIGDGMGPSPIAFSSLRAVGVNGRLHMETMPYTGWVKTYSATAIVTDSGAAATAMATGCRTSNGTISQTPDGKILPTMLEMFKNRSWVTGVISTKKITDATPAAFVAHTVNRGNQEEIAAQLCALKPDFIMGGGREMFMPKGKNVDSLSRKALAGESEASLLRHMIDSGYAYAGDAAELREAREKGAERILGLFHDGDLRTEEPEPMLEEMVATAFDAFERRDNGDRLFLMIEGAKIDRAGHRNRADQIAIETLHFDMAVGEALDFAKRRGDTLVVVTADHDAGGLGMVRWAKNSYRLRWNAKGHTATPVPVFAYGPGAEKFTGVMDNTEIFHRIMSSAEE